MVRSGITPYGKVGDHFGVRYGDILTSFCQISHTFGQREILLSNKILKYFPPKINWRIVQLKNDNLV